MKATKLRRQPSYREAQESAHVSRPSADLAIWYVDGAEWAIVAKSWFDARRTARVLLGAEEVEVREHVVASLSLGAAEDFSRDAPVPASTTRASVEVVVPVPPPSAPDLPLDSDRPRPVAKRAPCSAGHDGDLWCEYCESPLATRTAIVSLHNEQDKEVPGVST